MPRQLFIPFIPFPSFSLALLRLPFTYLVRSLSFVYHLLYYPIPPRSCILPPPYVLSPPSPPFKQSQRAPDQFLVPTAWKCSRRFTMSLSALWALCLEVRRLFSYILAISFQSLKSICSICLPSGRAGRRCLTASTTSRQSTAKDEGGPSCRTGRATPTPRAPSVGRNRPCACRQP